MNNNKVKIERRILRTPFVKSDFWSLAGSLSSEVKLSDDELRIARNSFSKNWADTNNYF